MSDKVLSRIQQLEQLSLVKVIAGQKISSHRNTNKRYLAHSKLNIFNMFFYFLLTHILVKVYIPPTNANN